MVTPMSGEPKYTAAAGQAVLKAICKAPALIITQVGSLIRVSPQDSGASNHARMTAIELTQVYLPFPF